MCDGRRCFLASVADAVSIAVFLCGVVPVGTVVASVSEPVSSAYQVADHHCRRTLPRFDFVGHHEPAATITEQDANGVV